MERPLCEGWITGQGSFWRLLREIPIEQVNDR